MQVLAQDFENLRHRHQHRDAARADLAQDFVRIESAHEDDHARQHRRNERRHGLAEHVAQRQQIEETDGRERARVAQVLLDLAFHRNNVGQNVPVRDDDALGFGRGAGGEDDLGGLIPGDLRSRFGRCSGIVHAGFIARQNHARSDDGFNALDKLRRRTVVDRNSDHAFEQASPQRDNPFRPVLAIENDLLVAADSLLPQPRGESPLRDRRCRDNDSDGRGSHRHG